MRALIVVCRYLGDTLLASPLARSLKKAGYEVDWLVASGTQHMIKDQPFADHIYVLDASASSTLTSISKLTGKYDVSCVITASDRPMLIARLAARKVFAMLTEDRLADAWKRTVSTAWVPYNPDNHIVQHAIALAKLAGVAPSFKAGLECTDKDVATALSAAGTASGQYVQLHPFARWPYKHWNNKSWRELIQRIIQAGYKVVITGGPEDQEKSNALIQHLDVTVLCGRLNWAQLSALSANAAAYVGVDTANTHLAAGTGVHTVALFGPTDPCIWGPWPVQKQGENELSTWQKHVPDGIQHIGNVTLIQGVQNCVPCQLEGCERHRQSYSDCLDSLDSKQVWNLVKKHLVNESPQS
ncbi:MAG: glycosyltransferase family 9 protein [Mariprofundaceae bacterium]